MKEPEVRKSEILDAAQKLFAEKGYAKATVTDILNVHGLSKGIFYYYFKSKEEVMDAIIERMVDQVVENAKLIASHPGMNNQQKIFAILIGQGMSEESQGDKEAVVEHLHEAENAEMHHKSLALTVKRLSPVIAEIISGGEEFSTDYPLETVEFLLSGGQFIFDKAVFQWNQEEMAMRALAFIEMIERALGAPKGYFEEIKKILT
jgi:AcrR family transcriptional regulator